MQSVKVGAAVACLGGRGGGQAVWHPFCHRQFWADPHRRGTGSCQVPSQQDGVCNVHGATTLQPAPAVSFTFQLEHCCHALFYLLAHLNIAMSAVPGASWMSGLRQMPMPVWTDEVFYRGSSGHRVRGSQDVGWHGSAAWGWQKKFYPCWAVAPQDKTSLSLSEALSKRLKLLQGFRRWKQWWKGWSNFLLNCTFSRYFDSELLQGTKNPQTLQLPVSGDKFHTSLFQDRSLLQDLASLLCAQGIKYRSTLQPVLLCLLPVPRCKCGKDRTAWKMGTKVS